MLQRVKREFQEIPGLCVTIVQAARLFGLPHEVCGRVLSELSAQRVIQQSGRYYGALRTDFVGALFIDWTDRWYR